jgi:putative phosphoesterase
MLLGVISDVHGDLAALERAWDHLTRLGVERVVCAGDVVGYGPEPDRVAAFLDEHHIATSAGNHDVWAARRAEGRADPYGGGRVGAAARRFLEGLPPCLLLSLGGRFVVVRHVLPGDDPRQGRPPTRAVRDYLDLMGAELLVAGHTHGPSWYRAPSGLAINPGSLVDPALVRSSRSFAVVDLETLEPGFFHLETGQALAVSAWPDDSA